MTTSFSRQLIFHYISLEILSLFPLLFRGKIAKDDGVKASKTLP